MSLLWENSHDDERTGCARGITWGILFDAGAMILFFLALCGLARC